MNLNRLFSFSEIFESIYPESQKRDQGHPICFGLSDAGHPSVLNWREATPARNPALWFRPLFACTNWLC
jgi:hypothetical protein